MVFWSLWMITAFCKSASSNVSVSSSNLRTGRAVAREKGGLLWDPWYILMKSLMWLILWEMLNFWTILFPLANQICILVMGSRLFSGTTHKFFFFSTSLLFALETIFGVALPSLWPCPEKGWNTGFVYVHISFFLSSTLTSTSSLSKVSRNSKGNSQFWWQCEKIGTRIHCWWECKMVQSLWNVVWWFLFWWSSETVDLHHQNNFWNHHWL